MSGIATVSVALTGLESKPPLSVKKVRPKPASPNRQGPQQCQVSQIILYPINNKKLIILNYRLLFMQV